MAVARRAAREFLVAFGICALLSAVSLIWDPVRQVLEWVVAASTDLVGVLADWRDSRRYLWIYLHLSLFVSLVWAVVTGIAVFRQSVEMEARKIGEVRTEKGRTGSGER